MSNPNLQQVCHRVFLGGSQDLPLLRGLLDHPALLGGPGGDGGELRRALERCADFSRLTEEDADEVDAQLEAKLGELIRRKIGERERRENKSFV